MIALLYLLLQKNAECKNRGFHHFRFPCIYEMFVRKVYHCFGYLGGAGGDGGKGQRGVSNLDKIPSRPADGNAKEVYERGIPDPSHPEDHSSHDQECCCVEFVGCVDSCTAHTSFYYHILDIKTGPETCGGTGGTGGNGGPGGSAGFLKVEGNASLEALIKAQDSNGGNPGIGGIGGDGMIVNSRYKGYLNTWDSTSCHGVCSAHCDSGPYAYGGYNANTSQDEFCPGDPGDIGNPGIPWTPSFH